ncbi:MAG TPA: LLM class flavin-dependent oxidoreductase, partial [Ktedonosporobacter sp.]|nr:LLM class flavin-dependent oxidoreductase [Ktedonosporobacter sp.]
GPIPSPKEARAYAYTPGELALAQSMRAQRIIGTPRIVKELLDQLIKRTRADELMIMPFAYGHENRLHMLEMVGEMFGLEGR